MMSAGLVGSQFHDVSELTSTLSYGTATKLSCYSIKFIDIASSIDLKLRLANIIFQPNKIYVGLKN